MFVQIFWPHLERKGSCQRSITIHQRPTPCRIHFHPALMRYHLSKSWCFFNPPRIECSWSKIVLLFLKRLTQTNVLYKYMFMTSVVSILQVIRDAAQRVYSFSNDQAGWGSLMAMATFGRGSNYTGNGSAWPSASTGSGLELKENLCPCMGQGCQKWV